MAEDWETPPYSHPATTSQYSGGGSNARAASESTRRWQPADAEYIVAGAGPAAADCAAKPCVQHGPHASQLDCERHRRCSSWRSQRRRLPGTSAGGTIQRAKAQCLLLPPLQGAKGGNVTPKGASVGHLTRAGPGAAVDSLTPTLPQSTQASVPWPGLYYAIHLLCLHYRTGCLFVCL